ncbi:hypothetical protein ACVMLK_07910 [Teichococcus aerofrigidensis]
MNFRKKKRHAKPANPQGKSVAEVPEGMFCSGCPHYASNPLKAPDEGGYCQLLNVGDWMQGEFPLLWDRIKICHIKTLDATATEKRRYRAKVDAFNTRWGGWSLAYANDAV